MRKKLEFNTACTACGKSRRRDDILYSTEDLNPYCANMTTCVDEHPNSYKNFAKTQKTVPMVPYSEAVDVYKQQLKDDSDAEDIAALDLTTKPQTLRIPEFKMAKYLLALKEERDLSSMNLLVISIIEDHMNLNVKAQTLVKIDEAKAQSAEDFKQQEQEQQERIEELNAVNKPVYTPDDDGDVI